MFAKSLGDAVAVMDNGRIVHSGAMAALAEDRDLQHRLLGLSLDSINEHARRDLDPDPTAAISCRCCWCRRVALVALPLVGRFRPG